MVIGSNSLGTNLNRMLDSLGYPDMVGDLQGAKVDLMTGNLAGYFRNMRDAFSGLPTQGFDAMIGKLPKPFSMQSPRRGLARSRLLHSNTYSNPFGTSRTEVRDLKMGRSRRAARSLERAIMRNPAFRNRMEGMLGGRIVLDGRADGRITVVKNQMGAIPPHLGFGMTAGMAAMNPMAGTLFGSLARMDQDLGKLVEQAGRKIGSSILGQQGTGQSDLGKLVGPNASIEDKLAAFLFTQMRDADKELEGLMKKYEALGKKKKRGGLFGGIKSFFKGVGQKLFKVGGGALGGMIGGPLGAKLGQGIGGALGQSALGGNKSKSDTDHSKSVLNFKIQQAMNRRNEIHDLISNILKTMHDMSMTSIRNIR